MNVSDFDYALPERLIAQRPLERRDASRLMLVEQGSAQLEHRSFSELPDRLAAGDLLVLNDTRVLPARLFGSKPTGGRVELLLLERGGGSDEAPVWRGLIRASRAPHPGDRVRLGAGLSALVLAREQDQWELRFEHTSGDAAAALEQQGRMPLPPYIRRESDDPRERDDRLRYQTVFARRPGAVAAPTAGLHFTAELFEALERAGIETAYLTLHVGPGTFQPVRVEQVERHVMHEEWFQLPEETARAVQRARRRRGRVVAVGTTAVRVLEHRARKGGDLEPGTGRCGLFIYPGFEFRMVDAMITNFHLPRSTLLVLVSAFAGRETVLAAYAEAIRREYRFYSYGDAMMIRSSRWRGR